MKTIVTISVAIFLLFPFFSKAGNNISTVTASKLLNQKKWSFEQNLGQFKDANGATNWDIKYYGKSAGVQVFCMSNKLSFVFSQSERETKKPQNKFLESFKFQFGTTTSKTSRVDMEFSGANYNPHISAQDRQDFSRNYFTGNNNVEGVGSFNKLVYENLYPNIDMILISKDKGIEYQFIVHPGGKVSDIKIIKQGMDKMEMLGNGGIHYTTSLGTLDESAPISYTNEKGVKSNFFKNVNNIISFTTEKYDDQKDLVIDPDLTWATYLGGANEDIIYGVITDPSGNVYVDGVTLSPSGIATKGAYQTALGGTLGKQDVFVAKYNSSGALQWATYYGGENTEFCSGIAIDKGGNLFVTGYTQSISGIATTGAYQTKLGGTKGAYDAFLAKFSNAGKLIWGTYFGGELDDVSNGVTVDRSNNVIIGGYTDGSTTGIASSGAFQKSSGGSYDVIMAKFTDNGVLIWSTYFGGKNVEEALGFATDPAKNIYVTGFTRSKNVIITSGAYSTLVDTIQGTTFLEKFDSNGVQKWGTYYGDTTGGAGLSVATNGSKDVFITGATASITGIATNGAHQTFNLGYQNAFLADFTATGKIKWGTYYGGDVSETGTSVAVDTSTGSVYITGGSQSTFGIATSGAYKTALDTVTGADAFMACFNDSGVLKYGTYFGGEGFDEGLCITLDRSGAIYVVGGDSSTTGIATSGAQQKTYGGGDVDGFIAKFQLSLCDLTTSASGKKLVCINDKTFYKAVDHGNAFLWTVKGGNIISGAGTDSIVVQWTSAGADTVKVKEVAISGCRDSVTIPVTVYNLPTPTITADNSSGCPPFIVKYSVKNDSGSTYHWTISGGKFDPKNTSDTITVIWTNPGTGKVLVKETNLGGCSSSDSTTTKTLTPPNAKWTVVNNGKGVYTFKAVDSASASFAQWIIEGNSITGNHAKYTFKHSGTYPIVFSIDNTAGCESSYDSSLVISDAGIQSLISAANGFIVYPNPFTNSATMNYTLSKPAHVIISISDMVGRTVSVLEDRTAEPGQREISISDKINYLEPGTYFIKLQVDGDISIEKVIRMKE